MTGRLQVPTLILTFFIGNPVLPILQLLQKIVCTIIGIINRLVHSIDSVLYVRNNSFQSYHMDEMS